MDDEREKGRIAGWLARLERTLEFGDRMVPIFVQMHDEAPATLRGYAAWLNDRDFKNEKGRVWRSETVSRIFSLDVRTRDLIEKTFATEIARRRYLRLDVTETMSKKAAYICRSQKIAELLRGPWEAQK